MDTLAILGLPQGTPIQENAFRSRVACTVSAMQVELNYYHGTRQHIEDGGYMLDI